MKNYLILFLTAVVLLASCKGKKTEESSAGMTKEEKIEQRARELESAIEKSLETADKKTVSPGDKKDASDSWGNAPDFTLDTVDGSKLTLSSYKGKVVILDFWATWCGPCKMGIPDFIKLYNNYRKDMIVIGVNLDKGNPDGVRKFVAELKINYPVVFGNQRVTQDYGGVRGIPTAVLIDRQGNISDKVIGYRPGNFFETAVKKLL